ncbi:MAG: hypothetical protein JW927_16125 [Deltaproteobacteria bacterium]|nr:hypothetical protein [Deltaproteobacteria bacterium]
MILKKDSQLLKSLKSTAGLSLSFGLSLGGKKDLGRFRELQWGMKGRLKVFSLKSEGKSENTNCLPWPAWPWRRRQPKKLQPAKVIARCGHLSAKGRDVNPYQNPLRF